MLTPEEENKSPSIKSSTSSVPVRPQEGVKKVGFRPTLIIPPPQSYHFAYGPKSAATISLTSAAPSSHYSNYYAKNGSAFMFSNLRDFTMSTAKSGLGMGEKSAVWMYSRLKAWSRKWFTHIFLTLVLICYTLVGASAFVAIEGYNEDKIMITNLRSERYALIRELRKLSLVMPQATSVGEWEGLAERKIKIYEEKVTEAFKADLLIAASHGDRKIWTFWNAVVYCSTVYTTIGYGHIAPITVTGRIITIVYAIVGIPLFLIVLTDFGKLFTRCIKFVWSFVRRLYYTGSCRSVRKASQVQDILKGAQIMYDIATFRRPSFMPDLEAQLPATTPISEDTPTTPAISNFEIDDEFNLPISVAILILILYIFMGALIYCIWEGWPFFKSFYFVFISMSTIGLGDVVPADPICTIVTIVYLIFGLSLTSMCINVVQEKLSDTFKHASAKIGATMGLRMSEEDGSINTVPPDPVEFPPIHENNGKEPNRNNHEAEEEKHQNEEESVDNQVRENDPGGNQNTSKENKNGIS